MAPTLLTILTEKKIVSVAERKTDLSHAVHNRRLDFVLEATDETGETELVQIEEETGDDADLADKLLGQLVAAKEAFGRYPRQFVGFMTPKAARYRNGLEVKNRRGEVVAVLRIEAFNFSELPSKPFFDLETPSGFSMGMFFNHKEMDDTEIMDRFLRLLPDFNEKERDKVAVAATLALSKTYIDANLFQRMMQALFANPDYGKQLALFMAFEAPYLSDHVKTEVERQIQLAVEAAKNAAAEKIEALRKAAELAAAEKIEAQRKADMLTTAAKLRAAGIDETLIYEVTGLRPHEYGD